MYDFERKGSDDIDMEDVTGSFATMYFSEPGEDDYVDARTKLRRAAFENVQSVLGDKAINEGPYIRAWAYSMEDMSSGEYTSAEQQIYSGADHGGNIDVHSPSGELSETFSGIENSPRRIVVTPTDAPSTPEKQGRYAAVYSDRPRSNSAPAELANLSAILSDIDKSMARLNLGTVEEPSANVPTKSKSKLPRPSPPPPPPSPTFAVPYSLYPTKLQNPHIRKVKMPNGTTEILLDWAHNCMHSHQDEQYMSSKEKIGWFRYAAVWEFVGQTFEKAERVKKAECEARKVRRDY